MSAVSIQQQIDWLEAQLRHMKRQLPEAVAAGRIAQDHADQKLDAAWSALNTLVNARTLIRADDSRLFAPYIGPDQIKRLALCSFIKGETMADCPLPWHSTAYRTWSDEFERLKAEDDAKQPGAAS